jgi:hypothetical protein
MVAAWKGFAARQKAEVCVEALPKDGRSVTSVMIVLSSETFFQADNFRDASTFELTAYSHAPKTTWSVQRADLITATSHEVGPANLEIAPPSPGVSQQRP